jgi:hypothetical protein
MVSYPTDDEGSASDAGNVPARSATDPDEQARSTPHIGEFYTIAARVGNLFFLRGVAIGVRPAKSSDAPAGAAGDEILL